MGHSDSRVHRNSHRISDAVASFSGELDATGDIDQLRNKLSEVTQGLGVAFDTTLVALVMSLIVIVPDHHDSKG